VPLPERNSEETTSTPLPERSSEEKTPTSPREPSGPDHVTECATVYSVLMACGTTGYTALYACFALTEDKQEKDYYNFWGWIILPVCFAAMGISFALKPRREDRLYKIGLYLQFFLFAFVSTFFTFVGKDESLQIWQVVLYVLLWMILFIIAMRCRSVIARLSDEVLSNFLTKDVIMRGMLVGLGQLLFLMFGSIQCSKSPKPPANQDCEGLDCCNRTLYSQFGLSSMVALFTIIKLISGVVPKQILRKHTISLKKVIAMDMNFKESLQVFSISVVMGCAIYALANYKVKGDVHDDTEKNFAFIVPSIGTVCMILTVVLEWSLIRKEMNVDGSPSRRKVDQAQSFSEDGMLVEGSSFWRFVGVLATTYFSGINVALAATAATEDFEYEELSTSSAPIVILLYLGSVLCQPRRRSQKEMWKLRLHFASFAFIGELCFVVYHYSRKKDEYIWYILYHIARLIIEMVLFHILLKLRAAIGRLPDEDLQTFLVNALYRGGIQTLSSILFLTFNLVKCMLEENLEDCSATSQSSTWISVYLLFWYITTLVQGSVRSERRGELSLSIEKIARMRDISLRHGVEGALSFVAGVCGIFLFAMMSAEKKDETTMIVLPVGVTGAISAVGVVVSVSFAHSTLKVQAQRSNETKIGQRETAIEEPVEECSWVFVGISFISTSTFTATRILYSVTTEEKYVEVGHLFLPVATLLFTMAMLSKPKRTDAAYKWFLFLHFFSFLFAQELLYTIGQFREKKVGKGCWNLGKLVWWCGVYWVLLKLRESLAKFSPQELSDFLCQTILIKCAAVIGTMLFFSFETATCFIDEESLDNGICASTSWASVCVSLNLVLMTIVSITSKAVPKSAKRDTAWELSSIATLKGLKWWQQIQGGLLTITAVSSLYLLGLLGVKGEDYKGDNMDLTELRTIETNVLGAIGFFGAVFTFIIGAYMSVQTSPENKSTISKEFGMHPISGRRFTASKVEDSTFLANLV